MNMKKIFSIFVMCLFMFSIVPMAFADEDVSNTAVARKVGANQPKVTPRKVTALNKFKQVRGLAVAEQAKQIKALPTEDFREFQKQRLMIAVDKCNELGKEGCEVKLQKRVELVSKLQAKDLARVQKLSENRVKAMNKVKELQEDPKFAKFKKDKEFKARELPKVKITNARAKFLKAKEKYAKAKENYDNAKARFQALKSKQPKCENDDCPELKTNAIEVLLHASDRVLDTLEKLVAKVESAEYLTEEESTKLIEWLNAEILKVQTIRTNVETFTDETPKKEVNAAFKELRQVTVKSKNVMKRVAGKVVNSRIGGIIVRSKQLQVKLNRILERMAENGKDTTAIEPLIEEFNIKLDTAKTDFEAAKTEFDQNKVQEGHRYMVQAKKSLAEAQKTLQQIVRTVVAEDGQEELADSEVDEVEDIVDEEGDDQ